MQVRSFLLLKGVGSQVDASRQIKMKKFLGLFIKGKQNQGNMYSLYDVSLPDSVDNSIPPKNGYKHYQFDSDCLNNDACISSRPRAKESSPHCSSASSQIFSTLNDDLFDLDADDLQNVKLKMPPVSDFSKSSSTSSLGETSTSTKPEQSNPSLEGIKKSTKNTYVITISNSKYFHIGSQKTVNISKEALPIAQVKPRPYVEGCSPEYEASLNKLLDCEDKLTEEYITIISLRASDKWKEFLRNLGLDENFLEVLEKRSDFNKTLALYDGLHEYITLFPSTSLSFVAETLRNTKEQEVIVTLAQEIKI